MARLLDAFNREYQTPTPGPEVLAIRLQRLLAGGEVIALLAGDPAVAVALVTLRPNVWYDGPVGLLDELYVAPRLRRRGVGSALLAAAEAAIRARGAEILEINVDGQDIDARRFYERHGYTNTEPRQDQPLLYYYRELTADPVLARTPPRRPLRDGLLDNSTAVTVDHEVVDFPTLRVQSPARPNLIAPSGAPHGASAPPCYALPISVCRLPVLVRPLGSAHAHNGVSSATLYVEMPDRSLESDPPDGVTADLDLNCIKLTPESWRASPNVVGLPRTHDG